MKKNSLFAVACALIVAAISPAHAHHGKDFLLVETDDMPLPGHVYALGSIDTNVAKDGSRSTEITPGLLFGNRRFAFEPHFHLAKQTSGPDAEETSLTRGFHYDATAFEVRYRIGPVGNSGWRLAVSGEVEKPKEAGEASEGGVRLIGVRTFPRALVAANLLLGRELTSGGEHSTGVALGVLTPLSNGDRVGLEVVSRFPLRDGIEIVPGYYSQLGKSGRTALKLGLGYYHSQLRDVGTLHFQVSQRF